ncbi:phosphoethanolamine transferase [uncultured Dialister sp.]|uniref:phosphoethanolamine transferase n=1 Tax=uncultured Dialister sp. TaxID=278064 RepID=UPI0027DDBF88|nr:phosphoethanolamine transferase [uncultured Dialister sp.]
MKVFLLFLQVGFVTAYFIRHHLKKAAIHLWLTIAFLWILSLVVPYLSTQTDVLLDMSDVSGELSTPLYLFISCLSAAWILPGKARVIARIACVVLIILYVFIQFTYIGYYAITHSLISINMMLALAQTNLAETMEYIQVNIPYAEIAVGVLALVILGWLIFKASRFSFNREQVSRKTWFVMLGLFIVNVGLCGHSIGATRLAHVYYETYETLHSFSDFQKMVNARRNMHIRDQNVVNRLKAAPDGVYVLVIGESLTRDHMNVYGYQRKTTPFQSAAIIDPHYTFFNHGYSCYTQTVQVLTEALTEKNQYNDMTLPDAYSIIDMAREAGFRTTWISNQSRFGVWDTPIGAIGSACDDQYWINQYVGTGVVTKDYDTALIPYLDKVDPNNRRQLIVVHLMGSHVSYWDRYPSEFYHWPANPGETRSTEEIMNDEYDNSVLFNDYVMENIMNKAVNRLHADSVLYFSDHGEQVTERPGHNADQFDYTMVHIPFWAYTSDAYRMSHPAEVATMAARRNMPFSNDMLYDTFMGIMGLTAAHYDPTADIFSPKFDKDITTLMTMYGNVMIRNDVEQLGSDRDFMDSLWDKQIADRAEANGHRSFDWNTFHPVAIAAQPMPEVENAGTSQE